MEPADPSAPPSEQTWETSNISVARWLLPLLASLALGWLTGHHPKVHGPWMIAGTIAVLLAWRAFGLFAAVQAVRIFFRSYGAWRKLTIAVCSALAFLIQFDQLGELFHWAPD